MRALVGHNSRSSMRNPISGTSTSLPVFGLALALVGGSATAQNVDFVKEVAPILVSRCIECHGADDPEADLRLDLKKGLFGSDKDDWLIVPGKPKDEKNEFFYRITLPADDDDIMPAEGKPLTKKQIGIIERWITQGAKWPDDGDAKIAAMIKGGKPKIEKIELPALSPQRKAEEEKALAAVAKAGGLAMRVAANTSATEVNLSLLGKKATNKEVALTAALSGTLIRLNLARTKVDDDGLAHVRGLPQLRWLNLANTGITDAGLRKLSGLAKLRYLNLYGTNVTDEGLVFLESLTKLQKLYLWQTKATKAGVKKLESALPNVRIDMGEYAIALAKIKPPAKKKALVAINKKCPLRPKKGVAPGKISVFEGQVIGFCCAKCKAKFDKNPAAVIGKVKKFKVAKGPVANAKCPVTNKAIDAGQTSNFRGRVIGFCCAKCKAKFDKSPDKFLPKLASVFAQPKKKGGRKKGRKPKAGAKTPRKRKGDKKKQ
jgi:YHS domain-containing protein/mono/diheme cytochrome c family protein